MNLKESEQYYNTGSSFCICKWHDECVLNLDIQVFTVVTSYHTLHDMENLAFSEEFRGCSARTPADSCAERHGSSAERPRIFRMGDTNFPQIQVENGRNQKVNFVHNNNARIEKDIASIVRIIIVGLDSLSLSRVPKLG